MIQEFLTHIWPNKGFYCIATPIKLSSKKFAFNQTVIENISQAANVSKKILSEGKDCYMAVGTLKERKIWNEKKKKYVVRVHKNMGFYKTLILDIDCGENKPYETQKEALNALIEFVKITGLPKPTIVNSGYGIHVYFTIQEIIEAEKWQELSIKLREIAGHYNLQIDNSRTCDKSSVLRVAGTYNYKKNSPKKVKVLHYGEPSKLNYLEDKLKANIEVCGINIHTEKNNTFQLPDYISSAQSELQNNCFIHNAVDRELMAKSCNFMGQMYATGGAGASEPLWWATLRVDNQTSSPDPHGLSQGHSDYDPSVTEAKIDRIKSENIGTAFCKEIRSLEHDYCEGCTHKVSTPLQLGRTIKNLSEAPSEEIKVQKEKLGILVSPEEELTEESLEQKEATFTSKNGLEITLPDPPYPYKRSLNGIYIETVDDEDGLGEITHIYPYDIYPFEIISDQAGYLVGIKVSLPHQKADDIFHVPLHSFTDGRMFSKLLADVGILPATSALSDMMLGYMRSYINEIQRLMKTLKNYPQLGWTTDLEEFVFPTKVFKEDGTIEECGVTKSILPVVSSFRKKGSLEKWREVIDIYAQPGYEAHAFGHLVGYASVLFSFTSYAGALVNMVGTSGSGKSTVLKTINSIFGHPEEPMLFHHDKHLAKMDRLGVFNSVCVTYDEITNIEPEELSDLCYSVTQGRGRHRLNQRAEAKENTTTWKLILASSSNISLMSKLSSLKHDASAESLRVFEYTVRDSNLLSKEKAMQLFDDMLCNNFGHAGEIFTHYVIQNQSEVRKLIRDFTLKFDAAANIPINERYWSAIVSCVLAGGTISNKLGLSNFNIQRIFDWAVQQILVMRGVVSENRRDSLGLLVEYMNAHLGSTFIAYGGTEKSKKFYTREEPRMSIQIRNEHDRGLAYLSKSSLRNWLIKGGADINSVALDLKKQGILLHPNKNIVLSKGSEVFKTGQVKCWMIDLNHPEMLGHIKISEDKTYESKVIDFNDGIDKEKVR